MLLYQASLDRVVSLGDIEDEGNLVASELEQVVVNISDCIGTLDSVVIQVGGSIPELAIRHESHRSRQ